VAEPTPLLHPAQNRGLRELRAMARQLAVHWAALAGRLEGDDARVLRRGEAAARKLGRELADTTAAYNLFGSPAAELVGGSLAQGRGRAGDRFLERNQALRFALLDAQHVRTLLDYQAALARELGQPELEALCERWERRIGAAELELRGRVTALAHDPDAAVEPVDRSPLGRAAHGAAFVAGSVGEWIDRLAAGPRRGGGGRG
jgi:hypothetical protein